MQSLFDIVKEIVSTGRERLRSPFIGAFTFSFFAFNWKAVLYLILSEASIEDRITNIETEYTSLWTVLGFPLLFSFVYLIGLPYIMLLIELMSKYGIKTRKENKSRDQGDDLDAKIDIAKKEFQLEQVRSGKRDLADLNDKIEAISTEYKVKEKEAEHLEAMLTKTESKVTELEQEVTEKDKSLKVNKASYLQEIEEANKEIELITSAGNQEISKQEKEIEKLKKQETGYRAQTQTLMRTLEKKNDENESLKKRFHQKPVPDQLRYFLLSSLVRYVRSEYDVVLNETKIQIYLNELYEMNFHDRRLLVVLRSFEAPEGVIKNAKGRYIEDLISIGFLLRKSKTDVELSPKGAFFMAISNVWRNQRQRIGRIAL